MPDIVSSTTCEYSFDPVEWEHQHDRPAELDSPWSCSREATEDTDYCKYHLSPTQREAVGITDREVCESFVADLAEGSKSSLRFIGAEFGDLDISHEVINRTTNHPIDLRYATIHGDFNAEQAVVWQPLLLDEATIKGRADFSDAELDEDVTASRVTFESEVIFTQADFEDDCVFTDSVFRDRANFDQARFVGKADFYATTYSVTASFIETEWQGDCRFQRAHFESSSNFQASRFHSRADFRNAVFTGSGQFSRCTFDDEAVFIDCEFETAALFKKTDFSEPAYYQNVRFGSEASWTESKFRDKLKFHFAEFHGEASISYCHFADATYFKTVTFHDYASFYESTFDRLADFRNVTFTDTARFMKARFGDEVFFDRSIFEGEADFRHVTFAAVSSFESVTFHASAIMQDASFADTIFRDITNPNDSVTIDLERANVDSGEFVQTTADHVYYNVSDGRIGNVDIEMPNADQLFQRFFIYRTEFDGFDFSKYRYVLSPDWTLHTFEGTVYDSYDLEANRFSIEQGEEEGDDETEQSTETLSLRSRIADWLVDTDAPDLEVTYLKAKNGAEKVGDSQAASQFFIKEMVYRRRSHLHRVFKHSEPLVSRLQLLFLIAMNLVLSITCGYGEKPRRTLGFSVATVGAYAAVFPLFVANPPFNTSLGYILLSIQSFTSLIFGTSASIPGFLGSFVVATEGFVGAFMIGLFIFALTRSVHR